MINKESDYNFTPNKLHEIGVKYLLNGDTDTAVDYLKKALKADKEHKSSTIVNHLYYQASKSRRCG